MLDRNLKNIVSPDQWAYFLSLESTQKIADIVFSCRERSELVERSLDAIMEFTNFDAIVFLVICEDRENLEVISARGVSEQTKSVGRTLPINNSFSGQAVLSKQIISSGELKEDNRMYAPVEVLLANDNFSSAVSVPLIYNDTAYGTINILFKGHHRDLRTSDYETMKTIGKMLSIALSNVEYVERFTLEIRTRKKAQEELNVFNNELENIVNERTKSLQEALINLEGLQESLIESEKMASLGGLVAGLSHEINTPLGVSNTSVSHLEKTTQDLKSEFMGNTLTNEDFKDKLDDLSSGTEILVRNIDRASELIKSFKQIAVNQSYENTLVFDVTPVVNSVITTLTPKWKSKNINFIVNTPEELKLHGYAGAFSQVFTNLIVNSLIHGFENTNNGTIEITSKQRNDGLCQITYKDDGHGVSLDNIKNIFDPFYTTKRGQGGTGLGLHLVYNLVTHKMQGTIKAERLNPGLCFQLTIPLHLIEDDKERTYQVL
ncbi:MAG: GAF domain-containing sensor histidine kinase [Cellvibrionaceae bacterium]